MDGVDVIPRNASPVARAVHVERGRHQICTTIHQRCEAMSNAQQECLIQVTNATGKNAHFR